MVEEIPEGMVDDVPDDAHFVYSWLRPDAYVINPKTGEPMYPPMVLSAMCVERAIGSTMSTMAHTMRSRGWQGEIKVRKVAADD